MTSTTNASTIEVLHATANLLDFTEYVTFGSLLIVSILIGIYYGCIKGNQNTVNEYMLGGKEMHIFPIAMSLITSHCSGITILGYPSETYEFGTQFMISILSLIVVVYITNKFFLPVFYSLQLYSMYEYLEMRFSVTVRKMCSFIFALVLMFYVPVIIYIPSLAFQQITGISLHYMTPVICFACIFYTTIGGLKAVVWTDAIQGVFTISSIIMIIILGISKVGNIQRVIEISDKGGRLQFFNLDANPFSRSTFWNVTIGVAMMWISALTIHPGSSQRFVALPTMKAAKQSVIWFGVGSVFLNLTTCFVGLIMYAHYWDCDPYRANVVNKTAQVLPHYVKEIGVAFPGLTGLFLSGLTSSALSTMSAGINTVSGTIYEDFVQNWIPKGTTDATASFIMKIFAVIFGIVCIFLVYIVEQMGEIMQMVYSLGSAPNGAVLAAFVLGLFFPWANSKGAICGMIGSLAFNAWLIVGTQLARMDHKIIYVGKPTSVESCVANATIFRSENSLTGYQQVGDATYISGDVNPMFALSFLYYSPLGGLIGIIIGLVVSFLTGSTDLKTLNPKLIAPGVRNFLPKSQKTVQVEMQGEYKSIIQEEITL